MTNYLVKIGITAKGFFNVLVTDAKDSNQAEWQAIDKLRKELPDFPHNKICDIKIEEIQYEVILNPSNRKVNP
jgi:hypothetical protein